MAFSIPLMKTHPPGGVNFFPDLAMFDKVVSGGQTGVDRAALDVALELGVPCGGWCPRGRRAEDGPIAPHYPLQETPRAEYRQRTAGNVRVADGTLVLTRGQPRGGTALTIRLACRLGKPCLIVDFEQPLNPLTVSAWAQSARVRVLNVAGPRESEQPGIHAQAAQFLREILSQPPP
jgi:hypothetical protein